MEEIRKKVGGDLKYENYLCIRYFGSVYPNPDKGTIACDGWQFCYGKCDNDVEFAEFTICDPNIVDNVYNFVNNKLISLNEEDKKRISKIYDITEKAQAMINKSCKKAFP